MTNTSGKRPAVLMLLLLISLGQRATAQEKSIPEKIRIAVATSSLAFLVPFVAKDRSLYLKNGSDVELIQMRPNIAMAALISGDIDYVELIGSVIRSAARNLPVRAISTGIRAPFFSIVAQTKYKSIKDLKGTVIGVASIGGTNQISTRITLKQFGLDPDKDIKFLAIGDEKVMYDAFKFGRVDSISIAPPFSVQLKREGYPRQHRGSRRDSIFRPGRHHRTDQEQSRSGQKNTSRRNRSAAIHSEQCARNRRSYPQALQHG
jgi:ABC-type nitrate/sulfonate/bicarbonate transport system substrate-binding protein